MYVGINIMLKLKGHLRKKLGPTFFDSEGGPV